MRSALALIISWFRPPTHLRSPHSDRSLCGERGQARTYVTDWDRVCKVCAAEARTE